MEPFYFGSSRRLFGVYHPPERDEIRDGAVLGLGELGTASATERLLSFAAEGRPVAANAIARLSTSAAGPILRHALLDGHTAIDTRVARSRVRY